MKIILIGYGKMGKMIEEVIEELNSNRKEHIEIVLKITSSNKNQLTPEHIKKGDVAIDFSQPDAVVNNIITCIEAGVPIVVGTTGWQERKEEVMQACKEKNGTFLYASNFSIGVNIFFEVSKKLAELMNNHPQYKITIEETHHIHKLDAPSGTAITLAEGILKKIDRKYKWVNKESSRENELPIISFRKGAVSGIHEIDYESEVDSIEIKHTAHSRRGFAEGAVKAAEWIKGRKGIFSMKDVLGI